MKSTSAGWDRFDLYTHTRARAYVHLYVWIYTMDIFVGSQRERMRESACRMAPKEAVVWTQILPQEGLRAAGHVCFWSLHRPEHQLNSSISTNARLDSSPKPSVPILLWRLWFIVLGYQWSWIVWIWKLLYTFSMLVATRWPIAQLFILITAQTSYQHLFIFAPWRTTFFSWVIFYDNHFGLRCSGPSILQTMIEE